MFERIRSWNERRPATVAVVGVLVSSTILYLVARPSQFFSDDFLNFARAEEVGLTLSWLNGELFGHWLPARKALDWGLQLTRPVHWELALLVLVTCVGISSVLLRWAVVRITRSTGWGTFAAVMLPLTACVGGTIQWYAGAAQVAPSLACSLIALCACLAFARAGTVMTAIASAAIMVASFFVAVLFDERAVVILFASPLLVPLVPECTRPLRRMLLLWTIAVPASLAWYLIQSAMTEDAPAQTRADPGTILVYLAKSLVQASMPALIGWNSRPALGGEELLWIIGAVVLALLITLAWFGDARMRALYAVAVFIIVAIATVLPAAVVRAFEFGVDGALEPRYNFMAMPFGVIAVTVVLQHASPILRRAHPVFRGLAICLVAIAAAASMVHLSANTIGAPARAWLERFAETSDGLRATQFYNVPVPESVVAGGFYPYNMLAELLPLVRVGSDTVVTEERAALANTDGSVTLVEPTIVGAADLMEADGLGEVRPGCWLADGGAGRLWFEPPQIPNESDLEIITVEGDFEDSGAHLFAGADSASLRDMTAGVGGHVPVAGSSRWVTSYEFEDLGVIMVEIPPGEELCVASVTIGSLPMR